MGWQLVLGTWGEGGKPGAGGQQGGATLSGGRRQCKSRACRKSLSYI